MGVGGVLGHNCGDILNINWIGTSFHTPKKFNEHFERHVIKQKEWNDVFTKKDYLKKAQNFLNSKGSNIDSFVSRDGWLFKYNKATNEFGLGHPNGTISTFYRPKDGMNYWYEQLFLHKSIILRNPEREEAGVKKCYLKIV